MDLLVIVLIVLLVAGGGAWSQGWAPGIPNVVWTLVMILLVVVLLGALGVGPGLRGLR